MRQPWTQGYSTEQQTERWAITLSSKLPSQELSRLDKKKQTASIESEHCSVWFTVSYMIKGLALLVGIPAAFNATVFMIEM